MSERHPEVADEAFPVEDGTAQSTRNTRRLLIWQMVTLATMYCGYMGNIICRASLDVSIPVLVKGGLLTNDEVGYLLSGAIGAYAVAKVFVGLVTDQLGGRRTLLLSLVLCASFTAGFGITSTTTLMFVVWIVARFTQAFPWVANGVLTRGWFEERHWGKALGVLSTSSRLGVVIGNFVFGAVLASQEHQGIPAATRWRMVFFTAAMILGGFTVLCFILIKPSPSTVGLKLPRAPKPVPAHGSEGGTQKKDSDIMTPLSIQGVEQSGYASVDTASDDGAMPTPVTPADGLPQHTEQPTATLLQSSEKETLLQTLKVLFTYKRFWIITAANCCVTPLTEMNSLIPMLISQQMKVVASEAAFISAMYPAGSAIGVLIGGWLYDRASNRQRLLLISTMNALNFGLYFLLMASGGLSTSTSPALAGILFFCLGFLVSAPYYLPGSIFSMNFGGPKRCGTVMASNDIFAYVMVMAVFANVGGLLNAFGWQGMYILLTCYSGGGLILYAVYLYAEVRSPTTPPAQWTVTAH